MIKKTRRIHPDIKPEKFYKFKNVKKEFLCALCASPRALRYTSDLDHRHYLQITLLSIALGWPMFTLFSWKIIFLPIVLWSLFELIHKALYRRDLACPHCGFDPTWYRRDVKLARRKVEEFVRARGLEPGVRGSVRATTTPAHLTLPHNTLQ